MPTITTVPASEVQNGDFLSGVGNGYVIEFDGGPDVRTPYNVRLGSDTHVMLTFNTDDGDEGYLLLPGDVLVTVTRD